MTIAFSYEASITAHAQLLNLNETVLQTMHDLNLYETNHCRKLSSKQFINRNKWTKKSSIRDGNEEMVQGKVYLKVK